eukprot:325883_1
MASFFFATLLLFTICNSNNAPIIGILTDPCDGEGWCGTWPGYIQNYTTSYIAQAYVQWIESGGGRVVPIYYDDDFSNIEKLLPQLNGVLFTGGGGGYVPTDPYFIQFNNILDFLQKYAIENKKKSQSIPVWATCLGFEAICARTAHNYNTTLTSFNASDMMCSIDYNEYGMNESRIFNTNSIPLEYRQLAYEYTSEYDTLYNDHWLGIDPQYFYNDSYLIGNFSSLGVSYDRLGNPFIALIESNEINGVQVSWYGSQFHPEKYYQFTPTWTPNFTHDIKDVISNQYFTEFFQNECRTKNNNQMKKEVYEQLVIYNFATTYIGKNQTDPFNVLYWFPQNSSNSN